MDDATEPPGFLKNSFYDGKTHLPFETGWLQKYQEFIMVFRIDFQAVIDFAARNTDPAIGPIAILDGAADGILKHPLRFNFFQYVKAGVPGFIAEENPPVQKTRRSLKQFRDIRPFRLRVYKERRIRGFWKKRVIADHP